MGIPPPWRIIGGGLMIAVRLTPRGGRDALEGIALLADALEGIALLADGRSVVQARVRAAPSKDAANAALIRLVAATLDTAPRNVSVAAGGAARMKQIKVSGDGAALAAALARSLGSAP